MDYLWSPTGCLPRQPREQRLQAIEVAFPLTPSAAQTEYTHARLCEY